MSSFRSFSLSPFYFSLLIITFYILHLYNVEQQKEVQNQRKLAFTEEKNSFIGYVRSSFEHILSVVKDTLCDTTI